MIKNKIIFNTYYTFRSKLININSIFIKYIYLISACVIGINIPQNCRLTKIAMDDTRLAFSINVVYLIDSYKQKKDINRIEVKGANFVFTKNILNQKNFFSNVIKTYKTNLIQIMKQVQQSGFVKDVQGNSIKRHRIKRLLIKMQINPLVKNIKVTQWHKLQISKTTLISMLKENLGQPKNYITINNSINEIQRWYKKKGFDWVQIKTSYNSNIKCLSFNIYEGKIEKIDLIYNRQHNLKVNILNQIEKKIIQCFNVYSGKILNVNSLQVEIDYLKTLGLISSCTYRVVQNKGSLNLILNYDIPLKKELFLHIKTTILDYQVYTQLHYRKFLSYINLIMKKIVLDQIFILNTCFHIITRSPNTFVDNTLKIDIKEILLQYILCYKYTSSNVYKGNRFFLETKKNNRLNYLNVMYSNLNIKAYTNLSTYFVIKYYESFCFSDRVFLLKTNKIIRYIPNKSLNSQAKAKNTIFYFKHNIAGWFNLTEKLFQQSSLHYKQYLNFQTFYNDYYIDKNKKFNIYTLADLSKIIKQKIIGLQLNFKYKTLSTIRYLEPGIFFFAECSSYFSYSAIKKNLTNKKMFTAQSIYIKYCQIFSLPQMAVNKYKSSLTLLIETNFNTVQKSFLLISPMYYGNKSNRFNKLLIPDSNLYKCTIEYHLFKNRYLSLYFLSSIHNCFSNNHMTNYFFQPYISSNEYFNQINKTTGLGLQLDVPINKISPIRIEFQIDLNSKKILNLSIYTLYY